MARVGILTGGGDCPGLNAVIRAVVRKGIREHGHSLVGFRAGWAGAMSGETLELTLENTSGILPRGGTMLGTSRTNPYKEDGGPERVRATLEAEGLHALIAVGGEDTLGVARRLHEDGVPVVGIPKTIDNDLAATDFTFGFHTAVQVATDAIDRLHTTAESHNRVMVVEVMGRHTGWIAVMSGIAGGADVILIPEHPTTVEQACDELRRRHERGKDFSIVVVSEGYELTYESGEQRAIAQEVEEDQFGHIRLGGVGEALARDIEERTGYETRVTVLGHVQRGGSPTSRDRVLATRFGLKAADLVEERRFGRMAALQGDTIADVSLEEATRELKRVPPHWYETARAFFG
jgi:6-phosphofructokinase 1